MDFPFNTFVKPYEKPATPEYYNKFFNPNICHVCKRRLETCQEFFKVCECNMISYCSDEHKKIHQKQHHDLCDAILKVNGHKLLLDISNISIVEWVNIKKQLLKLVQAEVQRELEPYEVQMFLFVKSCFVCHTQPDREGFCKNCHCINYCNDHKYALHLHKHFCSQLELGLSLELDIIKLSNSEYPKMTFIDNFPNLDKHLCNMLEFIKQYVLKPEQNTWFTYEFVCTDYMSGPLTVFYGITEMQLISDSSKKPKPFIIHIITAKFMDTFNLPAWELLIHLFNISLIVVMIEPKLNKELQNSTNTLCGLCERRSNTLLFEFYPLLYDDYVKTPSYKSPNLIVGFNVKFSENWSESIHTIQAQNCPLFLTTKSQLKAQKIIKDIYQVIMGDMVTAPCHVNKFCGYMPHRDSNTEYVYFLNKCLITYKNLYGRWART